ncbi:hypothetical protein HMPREF1990_00486, partial [Porphyromonas gingivalis W4087]
PNCQLFSVHVKEKKRNRFSAKYARLFFRCGARFFSFSRQKKNFLAPRFQAWETKKKSAVNQHKVKTL